MPPSANRSVSGGAGRRNAATRVIARLRDRGVYVSLLEVRRAWRGASPEQRETIRRLAPALARQAAGEGEELHEQDCIDLRGLFR